MKGMIIAFAALFVISIILLEIVSRYGDWINEQSFFDDIEDDLI